MREIIKSLGHVFAKNLMRFLYKQNSYQFNRDIWRSVADISLYGAITNSPPPPRLYCWAVGLFDEESDVTGFPLAEL
jgi:hypothetical protein